MLLKAVKAFCFLFTATVVLFVGLNTAVAYLYPRDTHAVLAGHPVFDEARRAMYERIYQLPIAAIRQIIAECWMENAWIFEPYVEFRERPRTGQYVNIAPDGFRLNGSGGRASLDPNARTVFLLGGSTMFGYGVRDEDTMAAHLQRLFRERRAGSRVEVYNFGRGYYGSSQEFLLLKLLVQRGMVPAVAVLMDGVNEHFCPIYSANMAEMFRVAQEDPWAKARAVVTSLPILRLSRTAHRTELAQNALYFNRALQGYGFECACRDPAKCHTQLIATYRLNKNLVRTLARQYGFEVHFILQPVGGYKNQFTTSPIGERILDRSALWRALEHEAMDGTGDQSFAGALDGFRGEPLVDNVHYTSAANRLLAERLFPSVVDSLAKTAAR